MDEAYVEAVLAAVEAIPPGRVMAYGQVAEYVGSGGPRQVGAVMSRYGSAVPWWRVVTAAGRLPPGSERTALAAAARRGHAAARHRPRHPRRHAPGHLGRPMTCPTRHFSAINVNSTGRTCPSTRARKRPSASRSSTPPRGSIDTSSCSCTTITRSPARHRRGDDLADAMGVADRRVVGEVGVWICI